MTSHIAGYMSASAKLRSPPLRRLLLRFTHSLYLPIQLSRHMATRTLDSTLEPAPLGTPSSSSPFPACSSSSWSKKSTKYTPKPRPQGKPKPARPTHFICIPVHDAPDLTANLTAFRPHLESLGLHRDCIRPAICLHLTLGVMSLRDEAELKSAAEVLREIRLQDVLSAAADEGTISGESPIRLTLRGLAAFPKPRDARVLYAVPNDPTGRLQKFAEAVRNVFIEKGLVKLEKGREELTLHATVANTTYGPKRQNRDGDEKRGRKGVEAVEKEGTAEQAGERLGIETVTVEGEKRRKEDVHEETTGDEETGGVKIVEEEEDIKLKGGTSQKPSAAKVSNPGNAAQAEEPKNEEEKGKKKRKKFQRSRPATFNAQQLVNDMKDYVFAETVEVAGVAICKMGAENKDGVKGGGGYPAIVWKGWDDEFVFNIKDATVESKKAVEEETRAQEEEMIDTSVAS